MKPSRFISLNCDLGEHESPRRTQALMRNIDAANIACGGHAGDLSRMAACVALARAHGVEIGAHPGPASADMGRTAAPISPTAFATAILQQTAALAAVAKQQNAPLKHIKLHGAWYHATENDTALRAAYLDVVATYFPKLAIYALAGGSVIAAARQRGLRVRAELFADRAYRPDGRLVPRSEAGAVLHRPAEIRDRLMTWLESGEMPVSEGGPIRLQGDSVCVHGDGETALTVVKALQDLRRPKA